MKAILQAVNEMEVFNSKEEIKLDFLCESDNDKKTSKEKHPDPK